MATWSFIVVSEHTELGVTLVTWPLATSLATPGHCGAGGVTFIAHSVTSPSTWHTAAVVVVVVVAVTTCELAGHGMG